MHFCTVKMMMLGVFLSTCVQDHFFCIPLYSTWRAALHRPLFSLGPFLQRSVTPRQSRRHNLCKIKDMISVSSTVLLDQGGAGKGTSESKTHISTAGDAEELSLNQHSSVTPKTVFLQWLVMTEIARVEDV